jgi:3-hydroxyisobutyrate dehydrogenase
MATIAFLGTGTMGLPMARNVSETGLSVRAWNRSRERAEPLVEHGAEVVDSPAEAAEGAETLVTMLSDADAVLDSAADALGSLRSDAVWVQMSTIGIDGFERCAELAKSRGVTLVDAPVLGTRKPAQNGELVILSSGPDEAIERAKPVFEAVGSRTLELGEAGAGTRCKLVVNSWLLGLTAVLAESISVAEVLEIDPQHLFDAIDGGPLDVPYARLKGKAMMSRSFDDVTFRLSLSRKDANLVLAAAQAEELPTPVLRAVAERLEWAERDGHGDEDMAATFLATAPDA